MVIIMEERVTEHWTRRAFTVLAALVMLLLLAAPEKAYAADYPQKFWDVGKDHWAFTYIADLVERGVLNGLGDGSFKPSKTVSRGEWAKMMVAVSGAQATDTSVNFTDMKGHWANPYVNAAKKYLTGYTDGSYRPNQAATREDVTVSLSVLKGYKLADVDYSVLSRFSDINSISNAAKGYVALAVQNGLINGLPDGTFSGQKTLTRAEAAAMIYRAFQLGNNDKLFPPAPDVTDDASTAQQETESVETVSKPSASENMFSHKIDTVCRNLAGFRSMILRNNGVVCYIDENGVSDTSGHTLELLPDTGERLKNPYLAYDYILDKVYLLVGGELRIYDITNLDSPALVFSDEDDNIRGELTYESDVAHEIEILNDGTLIVPIGDSFYLVNISTGSAVKFGYGHFYSYIGSSIYNKLLKDSMVYFQENEREATVHPLSGGDKYSVTLEIDAPWNNANSVCSYEDRLYFFEDGIGLSSLDLNGKYQIEIPKNKIQILDYQSLDSTTIWCISVNKNKQAAWYDTVLKCIRVISANS